MENTNYLGEQSGARAIVISIMTFILCIITMELSCYLGEMVMVSSPLPSQQIFMLQRTIVDAVCRLLPGAKMETRCRC